MLQTGFASKRSMSPLTLPFIRLAWSGSQSVAQTPLYDETGKPHSRDYRLRARVKLKTGTVRKGSHKLHHHKVLESLNNTR